ncbi:MAG: S8 family serine peptidase [Candidatus Magasanikbacteria bacterium]
MRNFTFCLFILSLLAISLIALNPVHAKMPNDPRANPLPWQYQKVDLKGAWDKTTGSKSTVIAVIDNGFDHLHPDLIQNTWKNRDEIPGNNIDDDGNGYVDDVWGWSFVSEDYNNDGEISQREEMGSNNPRPNIFDLREVSEKTVHHGTAVAGLIGAKGDNGLAGTGVNWDVSLMNLKVVDNDGAGTVENFPHAVRYAVNNGADVISFSLVGNMDNEEEKQDIESAIDYAYKNGVALVAAGGNRRRNLNKNPRQPVCADSSFEDEEEKILGVNPITKDEHLARFSNFGSKCIDIVAPGINLSSTVRYAPGFGLDKKFGGGWSGSSFAVPFVSGVAGLIKSIQPDWGPKKIYDAMFKTAYGEKEKDEVKYRDLFGAGLVQADEAIDFAWERLETDTNIGGLTTVNKGGKNNRVIFSESELNSDFFNLIDGKDRVKKIQKGNKKTIVLIQKNEKIEAEILSNNSGNWKKIDSFSVLSTVQPGFSIKGVGFGDINQDGVDELVFGYSDNEGSALRMFRKDGLLLKERKLNDALNSFTIMDSIKKDKIAILAQGEKKSYVSFLNSNLFESKRFEVYFSGNEINSGNIDNDKELELIISSFKDSEPLLGYLEQDGTIKRRFYSYDPGYRQDFDTLIGDINSDSKDEIITIPEKGQKLRAWSGEGDILKEVSSPGLDSFLIPLKN